MAKTSFYSGTQSTRREVVGPSPAAENQPAGKVKSSFYSENPSVDHLNQATDIVALATEAKERATKAANEISVVKTTVESIQEDILGTKSDVEEARLAAEQAAEEAESILTDINLKLSKLVQVTFVANEGQTRFIIPGGYSPGKISVYVNGRKVRNGDDVAVTSGTDIVFAMGLKAGNIVDVDSLMSQAVSNDDIIVGVVQASDVFVDGSPVWTQATLDLNTLARKTGDAQTGQLVLGSSNPSSVNADGAALVIREAALAGSSEIMSYGQSPSIGFHWSGVAAGTIAMHSDGSFVFRAPDYTGTEYRDIYAKIMHGTATSAMYADLAERYAADEVLEPGTVVELGGEAEITKTKTKASPNVFGVISTDPAFMMNQAAGTDETHPFVALAGRVPCKVVGPVRKGQRLVSSDLPGIAMAEEGEASFRAIIGRALENKETSDIGVVEIVLGAK